MFRPPSLLAPQVVPTAAHVLQGSRGFYIRAERASLPPHAPDMLAVRIQVIDGARTSTLQDPQPCRLLPFHLLPPPDILCANDSRLSGSNQVVISGLPVIRTFSLILHCDYRKLPPSQI